MQSLATKPDVRRKPRATGLVAMFAILVLLIAGGVVFGLFPRLMRQRAFLTEAKSDGDLLPAVTTVAVTRAPAKTELELPATMQALNEAPIYARVDGYIKARHVDIGQRVKKDELMVELDTPELDQQIRQAEAAIAQSRAALAQLEAAIRQARANAALAKVTAERVRKLVAEGVLSRQEQDDKDAALEAREADVAAAEANLVAGKSALAANEASLRRLEELKRFAHIRSPFDGFITYRSPDVGSLITAGNDNPKSEMFRVADLDPMRIFVSVPQSFVPQVQATAGTKAELTVEQLPGRKFIADVRRSNAALDPNSRTMLTVLYIANPKAELLPGMFAQVKFKVGGGFRPLLVPGDAVASRSDGPHVAVVDGNGTVHIRKIQPGHDFGGTLEVYEGLNEGEQVVVNPTDEIREGVRVRR